MIFVECYMLTCTINVYELLLRQKWLKRTNKYYRQEKNGHQMLENGNINKIKITKDLIKPMCDAQEKCVGGHKFFFDPIQYFKIYFYTCFQSIGLTMMIIFPNCSWLSIFWSQILQRWYLKPWGGRSVNVFIICRF